VGLMVFLSLSFHSLPLLLLLDAFPKSSVNFFLSSLVSSIVYIRNSVYFPSKYFTSILHNKKKKAKSKRKIQKKPSKNNKRRFLKQQNRLVGISFFFFFF
jgi:hypothetical protein